MTKDIEREALIAEIELFITEAMKAYVVERWADSYQNTKPFAYTIDAKNEVWWMKTQAHQLWKFWQAAKARMEVRINTLDEMLLNQGEALAQAKAQAVPEGFVLVKKRNMIGNPNVDWLQAPKWAKYWLKDGHSNKYWWSSIRPVKDMDMNAFCWKGDYFAKEAPDFSYSGPWDKSLTSRKAMIEAQEQANE